MQMVLGELKRGLPTTNSIHLVRIYSWSNQQIWSAPNPSLNPSLWTCMPVLALEHRPHTTHTKHTAHVNALALQLYPSVCKTFEKMHHLEKQITQHISETKSDHNIAMLCSKLVQLRPWILQKHLNHSSTQTTSTSANTLSRKKRPQWRKKFLLGNKYNQQSTY